MEHQMMWGALGIGVLGWVCTLLFPLLARSSGAARTSFPWLVGLVPIGVWLATLPTSAPFSAGQGWGRGFLIGGACSILSAWVVSRASTSSSRIAALSPIFAGIVATSIPLLWMRSSVVDALAGVAFGWITIALMVIATRNGDSLVDETSLQSLALWSGAAWITTLCGAAIVGVYRDFSFPEVARGTYPAVALVVAASVALVPLIAALAPSLEANDSSTTRSADAFETVKAAVCVGVPLGVGALLGTKILDDVALVAVIGAGSVLGIVLWALARDDAKRALANTDSTRPNVSVAAVVVALCAFMWAFQTLQGFGVGLMLLGAWPVAILAIPSLQSGTDSNSLSALETRFHIANSLLLSLSFTSILLLSRVFATRFRADLRGVGFVDNFAIFGFIAGAVLPALLFSPWFGRAQTDVSASSTKTNELSLARLAGAGAVALILLGAMLAVWGIKIAPAFFAGLALASVGFAPHLTSRIQNAPTTLFALALAWTLAQWARHFAPFAEMGRAERLQWVMWTTGALVVLVLIFDFGARFLSKRARSNAAAGTLS